ncbi:MAG: DoxX family protein [Pseudomonadota bacterium]
MIQLDRAQFAGSCVALKNLSANNDSIERRFALGSQRGARYGFWVSFLRCRVERRFARQPIKPSNSFFEVRNDRAFINAAVFLSGLRIGAALIFLLHGSQKLIGIPATQRVTEAVSLGWFAGVIEIVTGLAMLVGFQTRAAAFLASGTMAVAYWIAHAPRDLFPTNNGGDAAILYCFVFLYIFFAGAGPLSIDAMRRPKEE